MADDPLKLGAGATAADPPPLQTEGIPGEPDPAMIVPGGTGVLPTPLGTLADVFPHSEFHHRASGEGSAVRLRPQRRGSEVPSNGRDCS